MKDSATDFVPGHVDELRRRLLRYYDAHRRDLPWRSEDDPYRIWVSEVMLQQTRVETVIPYYRRWMEQFPELDDLASADREEVLLAWKGLGYYSRARNLHRAAGLVRDRHGGRVPDSVEELRRLPGVGEYTAGAVASIAFGVLAPAVDGNVRRVLSRLGDLPDPGGAELRRQAAALVDPERPGCFNQALMELGATVCTPSSPSCAACPVEDLCLARARGTVEERPPPRKRARVGRRRMAVAIAVDAAGRTLLVRRPENGLLGGMWEFPGAEIPGPAETAAGGPAGEQAGHPSEDPERGMAEQLAREAARSRGVTLPDGSPARLDPLTHAFTHLRVTYLPHVFSGADLPALPDSSQTADSSEPADFSRRADSSEPADSSQPSDSPQPSAAPVDSGDPDGDASRPGGDDCVRVVPLRDLDDLPLPVAQQTLGKRVRERFEEVVR